MKEPQPETSANDTKTKPGKIWLWGLAVIQLLAVMLLTWFGIEETMVKLAGFAILLLCGSMDVKALKKAGYTVPRWWWGLAVFLPPVYMIARVCKTDKAPAERVKRFAPVTVWILLLGMNMLLAGMLAIAEENAAVEERYYSTPSDPSRQSASLDFSTLPASYRDAMGGQMLLDNLSKQLAGSVLKVDEVSDVVFDEQTADTYQWTAKVKLSTAKGLPASDVVTYRLSYDNANDQFHYSMSEDDGNKLDALVAEGWK
jgi:hypothetical protein